MSIHVENALAGSPALLGRKTSLSIKYAFSRRCERKRSVRRFHPRGETLRVQNLMHSLSPSISPSLSFRLAPHSQLFRTPPPELKASKLPPLRRLLLVSRSASNGSIASEEASELANGEVGEHFSAKVEPPSPPPPPHIISAVPLPFPLCLARYALSDRRSSRLSSCSFLLRERGKRRGPL